MPVATFRIPLLSEIAVDAAKVFEILSALNLTVDETYERAGMFVREWEATKQYRPPRQRWGRQRLLGMARE